MIQPGHVAFIGTRLPTVAEVIYCRRFALLAVEKGFSIRTGRAPGIDSVATDAALRAGGTVFQFVPWSGFELETCDPHNPPYWSLDRELPEYRARFEAVAREFYPAFDHASAGVQKLKTRNVPIILGPDLDSHVEAVFAWPKPKTETEDMGGTGMGIQIAKAYGIPCFNFQEDGVMDQARAWLLAR